MTDSTVGSEAATPRARERRLTGRDQPAHPALKANLLMVGVVVVVVLLAVLSAVGSR